MYKRAALIMAIACIAAPLHAQSGRHRPPSRTTLLAELHLTDSQRAREKAIHNKYAPLLKAAKRASRDSAARIRDAELQELHAILTPSQQQKLEAARSVVPVSRRAVGPARVSLPR